MFFFDHITGSNATKNNTTVFENNIIGDKNYFSDRSGFDFHLTLDSPAVEAAGDPGVYEGIDLTPVYEYVHPLDHKQREANGHLDAGAFEFSDDAADNPADGDDSEDDPGTDDSDSATGGDQTGEDGGSGGSGGCYIDSLFE